MDCLAAFVNFLLTLCFGKLLLLSNTSNATKQISLKWFSTFAYAIFYDKCACWWSSSLIIYLISAIFLIFNGSRLSYETTHTCKLYSRSSLDKRRRRTINVPSILIFFFWFIWRWQCWMRMSIISLVRWYRVKRPRCNMRFSMQSTLQRTQTRPWTQLSWHDETVRDNDIECGLLELLILGMPSISAKNTNNNSHKKNTDRSIFDVHVLSIVAFLFLLFLCFCSYH